MITLLQGTKSLTKKKIKAKGNVKGPIAIWNANTKCQKLGCGSFAMLAK